MADVIVYAMSDVNCHLGPSGDTLHLYSKEINLVLTREEARSVVNALQKSLCETVDCDTCGETISASDAYLDSHDNLVCEECFNKDQQADHQIERNEGRE